MKRNLAIAALGLLALTACEPATEPTNLGGFTKDSRPKIQAKNLDFVLPSGKMSVYKRYSEFNEKVDPEVYSHPDSWVVYMAAPGWTNGGAKIERRISSDAASVDSVRQFIDDNNLSSKVKLAWLQYDQNPGHQFIESLDVVPSNFIPLFLKPHKPKVDFYIYSPAMRYEATASSMRYDLWLKPYLSFTEKSGDDYIAHGMQHRINGFDDINSEYWDNWSRHWFIVNPEGIVVDAYFSYIGNQFLYNSNAPIASLIYHLDLEPDSLHTKKVENYRFPSYYTEPYWDQMHNGLMELVDEFK